jgi:hypothetical protein
MGHPHSHACTCMYSLFMRTTVDIRDEHRAALLKTAARRGKKGFSSLLGEALEAYLRVQKQDPATRKKALSLRGALAGREAERLRRGLERRSCWRRR